MPRPNNGRGLILSLINLGLFHRDLITMNTLVGADGYIDTISDPIMDFLMPQKVRGHLFHYSVDPVSYTHLTLPTILLV